MKVALVHPPTADPTAPYVAIPALTGFLRAHGVEVLPVDANLATWEALLTRPALEELAARLERRLARLDARPSLGHGEQRAYATLWEARGAAVLAPAGIEAALRILRDPEAFYDAERYAQAVATVEAALLLVGAVHAPLTVDFVGYRTPFGLLSAAHAEADSRAERSPFRAYFEGPLATRLATAGVGLVGVSVAFPGQVLPAYTLGHALREALPGVHLTVGGPAITQILARLEGERAARALGPFDTAVLFEGEDALLTLVRAVERGEAPRGIVRGTTASDLARLPAPDFDGLPLDRYLAPSSVLPYDPSRGCYWGRCAFCHYGLSTCGTARYRERPVPRVADDLRALAARHDARVFYLSEDTIAPATLEALARALVGSGLRWATDIRPERGLTPERCQAFAAGGGLAVSVGLESGAPRVLALIDKGATVPQVEAAVQNLAGAGLAVEAMCFTGFPTETLAEARATLQCVERLGPAVALFMCGEFGLSHGARVATEPERFGIREIFEVEGDELGAGLFYEEARPPKSAAEQARLDDDVARVAERFHARSYPWAGSLSTAHTLLWYERFGPDVFRRLAAHPPRPPKPPARLAPARFDVAAVGAASAEAEAAIWSELVHTRRHVSRAAYRALAEALPVARPRPGRWRYAAGRAPERIR